MQHQQDESGDGRGHGVDHEPDDAHDPWLGFTPPRRIGILHPWVARYSSSVILYAEQGPTADYSDELVTEDREIYRLTPRSEHDGVDDDRHALHVLFRIGNGGAGYTGILRVLAERFLVGQSDWDAGMGIGWVANHSRLSQAALLADIVQVALTYEPDNEQIAVDEGWARNVGLAFWDHFLLVGPKSNPANLRPGMNVREAFAAVAETSSPFHSRGDGSATFHREQKLWRAAAEKASGNDVVDKDDDDRRHLPGSQSPPWLQTFALAPYQALQHAHACGAYLLTDRATLLTAKRDGVVPHTIAYVEGCEELLNPCSALVNVKVGHSSSPSSSSTSHIAAVKFAEFLLSDEAQRIVEDYGKDWPAAAPLFTPAACREFDEADRLWGKEI